MAGHTGCWDPTLTGSERLLAARWETGSELFALRLLALEVPEAARHINRSGRMNWKVLAEDHEIVGRDHLEFPVQLAVAVKDYSGVINAQVFRFISKALLQ